MEIREFLAVMVEKEASDVYLTVGLPPMYRIEGTVSPHGTDQLSREGLAVLCQSIMDERQKKMFADTREMNLALGYEDLGRFRVNSSLPVEVMVPSIRYIGGRPTVK